MSQTYKTVKFDPDQWMILTGKEKHELELVPGWLDVWVDWKADADVQVWLYFTDGKRVPYAGGKAGHFCVRTLNVLSVVLETLKRTTVSVCVSYQELSKKEKGDPTRITVQVPPPAVLSLQESVRRELIKLGLDHEQIEVDDEDNLEDDIPDEADFGEGYMDAEFVPTVPRKGKQSPAGGRTQGNDPGGVPDGPKPDPSPGGSPEPSGTA